MSDAGQAGGAATAVVPVKSAWASKINWIQVIGWTISIATALVEGLPPEKKAAAIIAIQTVQNVATFVIRTWFTSSVTAASLPK